MSDAAGVARWRQATLGRTGRVQNRFAFFSLVCGICAWVPLVILVTGPLAVLFALMALITSRGRGGLEPARAGLILTALATVIQGIIFASAGLLGWVVSLIS